MRVFDVEPIGAVRMTQNTYWKPASQRYFVARDRLRNLAAEAGCTLGSELYATFVHPMPRSWSKKRAAAMAGQPCGQKPDIDNVCKFVMDCLCVEDKHVSLICCEKRYGLTGKILLYDGKAEWEARG